MKENCIIEFLTALKSNNSLEWMHDHKEWYREASEQFLELLKDMITALACEDESLAHLQAKDLFTRLNRDTRFSHDKSPYNPSFRAHISSTGRAPIPVGYYLHISPGNIFLGGGLFASMFKDATAMIRSHIAENGDRFLNIVNAPDFKASYILIGEKLKKVPKEFDADLPHSEYLKHKSWALEYHMEDADLDDRSLFCRKAVKMFLPMKPFNDFMNEALKEFKMPER